MPRVSLGRLIVLSVFGFSIPLLHGVLEPAVYGYRTLALAPHAHNTALGVLTFAGLAVATLWQPIVGGLSDRAGKRLPFMIAGTVIAAITVPAIVLAPSIPLLVA